MSWRDALALATRSLTRRFGRAALTVMSVALAAALLTALLTIASTAETRVLGELAKGGPLAGIRVAAAAPNPGQVDNDNPTPGAAKDLTDGTVREIAHLPDVASVLPVISVGEMVVPPKPSLQPFFDTVVGVDTARERELPVSVLAGRLPAPGSLTEVAVTDGYLERLQVDRKRPSQVVGTEIEIGAPRFFGTLAENQLRGRWTRAEVVGVVAQEAGEGDILSTVQAARLQQSWSRSGGDGPGLRLPTSPYSGLLVVARGLDRVGPLRHKITAIGYSTSAPENLIASVLRYLHVVEIVLAGIGAIALVIASLGIASALFAAIRERRREIGVLKAIGARDRDVLRLFLIEASMMGLMGGLLGTAAGWAVARTIGSVVNGYLTQQGLAGVALNLPPLILAGGVAGSAVLATIAGALPALRAARLPAREAVGDL
jgi:ABC-type antimicrobial peptide transport system permease subunit